MMESISSVVSPGALVAALLLFGLAPGLALRAIVLAYPRDDVRRKELLGELYAVPRHDRPFWVLEQLERALFEGLSVRFGRWKAARQGRSTIESSADAGENDDSTTVHGKARAQVTTHGHGRGRGRVMTEDVTFAPATIFEPVVVKVQPASIAVEAVVTEPVVKAAPPDEGYSAGPESV